MPAVLNSDVKSAKAFLARAVLVRLLATLSVSKLWRRVRLLTIQLCCEDDTFGVTEPLKNLLSLSVVQEAREQDTQVDGQAHAAQIQNLQAAHEQELRNVQQAAQQAQADLQAAHAVESNIIKEAHAADLARLRQLQDALPQQLMQLQAAETRHPQDLSASEIGEYQCSGLGAACPA